MNAASPSVESLFSVDETGVLKAPQFTREELDEAMRTRNDVPRVDFAVTVVRSEEHTS